MRRLVLASTSPFRKSLLERLQIPFETANPATDEAVLPGEGPEATARRLSQRKARAVASHFPDALIIGSDQVASLGSRRFGKPLHLERAVEQLQAMRGETVVFHTGLCLYDSASGHEQLDCVPTRVTFRDLSDAEIRRYLEKDQPYQCAGSAKAESLGIALLSSLQSDDPNALIGLPLIALCRMLRAAGIALP